MAIWIKVTRDRYELPVAVADSATELAKICGTTKHSILSAIYHARKRKTKCSYVKVEDEDE